MFSEYFNNLSKLKSKITHHIKLTNCSLTLKPEKHKISLSITMEYKGLGFNGSTCTVYITNHINTSSHLQFIKPRNQGIKVKIATFKLPCKEGIIIAKS